MLVFPTLCHGLIHSSFKQSFSVATDPNPFPTDLFFSSYMPKVDSNMFSSSQI